MSSNRLANKVAIITGASQGIGRAIAVNLARNGAKVVLTARNAEKLEEVLTRIRESGNDGMVYPIDLKQIDAPQRVVEAAIAQFAAIDILVNNAGATKRGSFTSLTEEDWQDGFALKFFGSVRLVRAAWPYLKARSGSIVNIAGVGGRTPGAEFTIGGSVNAAILSFTKAIAELGVEDRIQINAINPGFVRTARLKKRLESLASALGVTINNAENAMVTESKVSRLGEPEDIAHLVTFIVSLEGRFLHGSLIDMDGGQTKTI